jgi:RimJ/RimL family protein N-acetyltransferase
MDVFLETERLVLRRFTTDDVDSLVDLDSDPDVMKFINGGTPTPREEVEEQVLPAILAFYERGDRFGFWAIIEKESEQFLGWLHLRPGAEANPDSDEPELGYRLVQSAWGKGYATEASAAVLQKAFSELGVARVTAAAMVINTPSRNVMKKLGMTLVRTFRPKTSDGRSGSLHSEFAIDRETWEQLNEPTEDSLA